MLNDAAIGIVLQQQSVVDLFWWQWPTDEFAAWGQWAGGIGAIAAVGLAWWTIRRDRKKHLQEMASAARADSVARLKALADEEERHAARARSVVAGSGYRSTGQHGVTQSMPLTECGVEIANYSSEPVLEVVLERVDLLAPSGEPHHEWLPDWSVNGGLPREVAAVIGSGGGKHLVDLTSVSNVWRHVRSGEGVLRATFTFLDVEGYRWRRVGSNAPVRITADGSPWKLIEVPGPPDN